MLKFLLIVSFFLIPLSAQTIEDCTTDEQKKIKPCIAAEMLENLKNAKVGMPKPAALRELSAGCKKTIECIGDVKCHAYIDKVVKNCESIDVIADLVPCFMNVTETVVQNPDKYTCLKENGLTDVTSQKSMCKFTKTPCFDNLTNEICGKKFNSDKVNQFATSVLKCT